MITFCQCTHGEVETGTLRGVASVRPYVDRIIIIHDNSLSKIATDYLQSLGAELYYESWTDYFSEYRNKYLERVEDGSWVFCNDPDEYFDEKFLKESRVIIGLHDKLGYNRFSIRCTDRWVNDDGTFEDHPTDWYKPTLLFQKHEGCYYSGQVHETLHGQWDMERLSPEYFYIHTRSQLEVLEKSMRNVFINGGFDEESNDRGRQVTEYARNYNCSILEAQAKLEISDLDEWVELHKICDKLGLNSWTKLRTYCRKGNIDKSLLEWIRNCRNSTAREYPEIYKFFLAIHPEELE